MKNTSIVALFVSILALAAGSPASAKDAAKASAKAAGKGVKIQIVTSMGKIEAELDEEHAPISVKNFVAYVKAKHYDGTIFHRVIPDFMIQGGGFDKGMKEKSTQAPIKNEAGNGLKNVEGTLAMARTGVVDSATAQFYINLKANSFLDHRDDTTQGFGYAVFGRVTQGMDVVHKIEHETTTPQGMFENVPVKAVTIQSIRIK